MAISAATYSHDAVVRDDGNLKSFIENALPFLGTTSTFVQGDLIALDGTNHILNRVAADTDGATILGVAPVSVTNGVLVGPYPVGMATIGSQKPQACQGPLYGCVAGLKVSSGDALTPGCKVYLPATGDSQTVSVSDAAAAGDYVGVYMGPAVTAVAGVFYPIKLGMRLATGEALQF
jgi:hypothetical protein